MNLKELKNKLNEDIAELEERVSDRDVVIDIVRDIINRLFYLYRYKDLLDKYEREEKVCDFDTLKILLVRLRGLDIEKKLTDLEKVILFHFNNYCRLLENGL
jgi:hypothetical protein